MANVSGLWNTYKPGEASYTLYQLIKMFSKERKQIILRLKGKKIGITHSDEVIENLRGFETSEGAENMLEEFCKGLKFEVLEAGKICFIIEIILRTPEGKEKYKDRFRDTIVFNLAQEGGLFCEKYYRYPEEKFFKNRLDASLEKVFHFPIQYKVLVWSV
jgi:hypothetical protein